MALPKTGNRILQSRPVSVRAIVRQNWLRWRGGNCRFCEGGATAPPASSKEQDRRYRNGVIFVPFQHSIATIGAVTDLYYPAIPNAVQGKKIPKSAPFQYRKREDILYMAKQNRKWNIQLIVRVTEKEKDLIQQKMAMLKTENLSAYIRKIAVDGHIINVDHTDVKNHAAQLQRVGGNINQIAKRMNQTGSLYSSDVAEVKKLLHDIWLSERQLLLKMR
jgi:hypothetical protein